jgi:hypothetical protein
MHHDSAHRDKTPSSLSAFRTKVVRISILLLVLSAGGLWLMADPPTDLRGTWKNDEQYLVFTNAAEGIVYVQSRNCEGYPFDQKGYSASLKVVPTPGVLFFPERFARQTYRVFGLGHWLVIDDTGPIPPGSYTYISANTFAIIGVCGLEPRT